MHGKRHSAYECPLSLTTADSWAWIEEFWARRCLGPSGAFSLDEPARNVEAFLILEAEAGAWRQEDNGESI